MNALKTNHDCSGCGDGCILGRIRMERKPLCPVKAVIPLIEVDTKENLKSLHSCFVYVRSTNETFYIDNQSRFILCWAGMVFQNDYDYEANPLGLRGQMVPDFENGRVIIYNNAGDSMVVGEGGGSIATVSDADWAALWS